MIFERTIQLIGENAFQLLQTKRVILFGVGGVGGWCAEALIRTGLRHLTIVDFDIVSDSNINRQIVATRQNIGKSKVDEMKRRLISINPDADIECIQTKYGSEGSLQIDFTRYDYVIDAIDSIDCKIRLIYEVTSAGVTLFSSMGAGRKIDTTQIKIAEFWKVEGCPLARALRTKMRKLKLLPQTKFQCVYSPEISADSGTIAPIVGIFGFTLADLILKDIIYRCQ